MLLTVANGLDQKHFFGRGRNCLSNPLPEIPLCASSHVHLPVVAAAASESSTAVCWVFANTDLQNIPFWGIRFRPNIANSRGTSTYSVSHWLIMKSVNPANALSTASRSVKRCCPD